MLTIVLVSLKGLEIVLERIDFMFVLEKIENSKTLKVKIDGETIDQIHYDDINSLCDILNKYYYNELMQEID